MLRRFHPVPLLLPFLIPLLASCLDGSGPSGTHSVQWDTLANGVVHVRYTGLVRDWAFRVAPDLRLGVSEGDPNLVFGDIRSVDADRDGRIYVLDVLASHVRVFDATGRFLHNLAGQGEGPGEIEEANGMILVGDSILWIQDHANWRMIGLSLEGEELIRAPMPVLSYGHTWDGTVDNKGRIWKPAYQFDPEDQDNRREGLTEVTGPLFLKSLDPSTNAADSVFVGNYLGRVFRTRMGGGWLNSGIPLDPELLTAVDPDGGFWQVHNASYTLARLDKAGDTTLVLDVDVEPIPVRARDKTEYIELSAGQDPRFRRVAEQVVELFPETKPVIQRLIPDDESRLWVERTVEDEADPLYDVFDKAGEYRGSVELAFKPSPLQPIRIRYGNIYAVVLDDLDVPSVVRAKVPTFPGGQQRP